MKSVKLENGIVKIVEENKPELQDRGAIIKVEGCGLCGSDIVKIREKLPNATLGHEIVGEIVEINSSTSFQTGDKIVMGHHYPCFECEFCKNESYSMCKTFKSTNIRPGGFSEYIFASEGHLENTVFKLPENYNPIIFSFTEPLACVIRALKRANLTHKSDVLTLGLGSIGILMTQTARIMGHNSYGFDTNPKRQECFGFNSEIKYDAIFMTSGSSRALESALSLIKDGGKIIIFSSIENDLGYKNNDIYYRELSIIGSYSPSPIDLECAYDLINEGKIGLNNISTVYSLADIQKAIDDTMNGKIYKAYIKL